MRRLYEGSTGATGCALCGHERGGGRAWQGRVSVCASAEIEIVRLRASAQTLQRVDVGHIVFGCEGRGVRGYGEATSRPGALQGHSIVNSWPFGPRRTRRKTPRKQDSSLGRERQGESGPPNAETKDSRQPARRSPPANEKSNDKTTEKSPAAVPTQNKSRKQFLVLGGGRPRNSRLKGQRAPR